MIPIYSQSEIKEFDRTLQNDGLIDEAISRAGYSVFYLAGKMLGGFYGKRVVVLYGPGNNGKDALKAAEHLSSNGARVAIIEYGSEAYRDSAIYAGADLVIDGCFGIGLSRPFVAPPIDAKIKVLSIDVPSGIDGDTGEKLSSCMVADATLCLAGIKAGVFLRDGKAASGKVYVSGLGLGSIEGKPGNLRLVEDLDVVSLLGRRHSSDNKWSHGVAVVAGSAGMTGAAEMVSKAAYLTGAGIVHLFTESPASVGNFGIETVVREFNLDQLSGSDFDRFFEELEKRFKVVVVGPGLGRREGVEELVSAAVKARVRLVLDADAINAIPSIEWLSQQICPLGEVVLTPHFGELKALVERSVSGPNLDQFQRDPIGFAREFARIAGVIILVKGGPTIVASPEGDCYMTIAPTETLAVAGSGDVLSGMIGASLAYPGEAPQLVSLAAHLHGLAGRSDDLIVASELPFKAREILSNLSLERSNVGYRVFPRPTSVLGNLVANSRILGK